MNAVTSENPTGGSETSSTADAGPTEIIFGTPAEPTPVDKSADITDVEPKTEKSNSAAPKPAGTDEAGAAPPANEEVTDGSAAKPKSGIQDRIGELTKARRDAEREAAYWKNRATQDNEAEAPAPLVAPKPEDFKTPEEYEEARIDYKVELKVQQKEQQRSEAVQRETQQKAAKAASDNRNGGPCVEAFLLLLFFISIPSSGVVCYFRKMRALCLTDCPWLGLGAELATAPLFVVLSRR